MGQAVIKFRKTVAAAMIQGTEDPGNGLNVNEFIGLLLALPPNTRLVSVTPLEMNPGNLYYEFNVIVENKIFRDGSEIKPNLFREVAYDPTNSDRLVQFNAFKGLDYKDALYNNETFPYDENLSESEVESMANYNEGPDEGNEA